MARFWARILMGLIFVFATISSPLHAQVMPSLEHAAPGAISTSTDGMSAECAKAMAADAARAKPHKSMPDHAGGCCTDGCSCPLSHCPATPPMPAEAVPAPVHDGALVLAPPVSAVLASVHTDAPIRPPRARS